MADLGANAHIPSVYYNRTIRVVASVMGVAIVIAGITHGYWEMRQGNISTPAMFIDSVGPEQLKWSDGQDPAFTLIPNFLATGIINMTIGVIILIWSVIFIHRPRGPLILLLLFIAQTLAGGGVGYIPFYLVVWAYATRINKPLTGWQRVLSPYVRKGLAKLWAPAMILAAALWVFLLELSIYGFYADVVRAGTILMTIWMSLLVVMFLMNLAFIAAAARDIALRQKEPAR